MDVKKFKKLPLVGILRGIRAGELAPLVDTIIKSGLETIEITMNTKNAAELIRQAVKLAGGRLTIGAGTVLDLKSLKSALGSGATFIVTPVLIPQVARYCQKSKIPGFFGALTPAEIYAAWQAGSTMVKVFPAKFFGPDYFKEIKGPFDKIELLACGGVAPENLKDYFAAGVSAASFGASVFRREWLDRRDYNNIGKSIERYLEVIAKL